MFDTESETTTPRENALAFLLRTGGPSIATTNSPSKLEILAFVGEEVVDVQHVDGRLPIALASNGVDPTSPALITRGGSEVHLLRDPRGWVFLPGFDMVAFVDTLDSAERTVVTGETVLRAGQRLLVEVGPVIYVIAEVQPAKKVPSAGWSIDTPMLSLLSFLGVTAGMFGYALGTVPPPPEASTMPGAREAVMLNLLRLPPPPPPVAKVKPASTGAHKGPEGKAAKGHEKPEGVKSLRPPGLRMFEALNGVLPSVGEGTLPGGLQDGIAGLRGRPTSTGGSGFNARGDGWGGGGETESIGFDRRRLTEAHTLAQGGPGDGHTPGKIEAMADDKITLGALDGAEIDKVIKRNMQSIRYCYQKELQAHPGLGGKVTMKFTIAADGSVSSATTRHTVAMPTVESCLTARFLRMEFPEPRGGGVVLVSYPFVFSEG